MISRILNVKEHINRYLYTDKTIAYSVVLSMILWFLSVRKLLVSHSLIAIAAYILVLLVSITITDRVIYLFDVWIEVYFRKMVDDEGLILPRNFDSDRLKFRELQLGDERLIYSLSRSEDVIRFVDDIDDNLSIAESRTWLVQHMNIERTRLRCTRVLIHKATGKSMGAVVIINGHEVEYWMNKAFYGQGYGYEAVRSAIDVIEQEDHIVLFAHCYESNLASQKLLTKVGFVLQESEATQKQSWIYEKNKRIIKNS